MDSCQAARFVTELRILLADDHEVVRKGLRALLDAHSGWKVIGEASDGREAVEKVAQLKPDIVIMDITMPELTGLEAAKRILADVPGTELLFFTMHNSDHGRSSVRRRLFEPRLRLPGQPPPTPAGSC